MNSLRNNLVSLVSGASLLLLAVGGHAAGQDSSNGLARADSAVVSASFMPNTAPVAENVTDSLDQGTSLFIIFPAFDPDGDDLTVITTTPQHGTLSPGFGLGMIYTPDAGYTGPENFSYYVMDTSGEISNFATVSLTVLGGSPAPVAQSQTVSGHNRISITLEVTAGNLLTYSVVDGPAHGTLTGTAPNLTYTPASGYSGPDSFTFIANDGLNDSNTATVSIDVANAAPTALDDIATAKKGKDVTIVVLGNDSDADGDAMTISSFTQSADGTVVKNTDNTFTFSPNKKFLGTTSFTYTVSDGHGGSTTATVTVTVVNNIPKK